MIVVLVPDPGKRNILNALRRDSDEAAKTSNKAVKKSVAESSKERVKRQGKP